MTEREGPVIEADLHALVDGELDPKRRRLVEDHLAAHPSDAHRLESYRHHDRLIRRAYRPLVERALPDRLLHAPRPSSAITRLRWRPLLMALAASMLLLMIGAAAGWFGRGSMVAFDGASRTLVADAVDAHLVYAVEVRHPVEVGSDERGHLQTWLSRRLDVPLTIPDLGEADFELIGGRLLPAEGGSPAAQLMYENVDGQRVTVYLRNAPNAPRTAFRFSRDGDLSAFSWTDRGVGWAILGAASRSDLLKLAHLVHAQLDPT
jgi:anti-sigma factor RsiW